MLQQCMPDASDPMMICVLFQGPGQPVSIRLGESFCIRLKLKDQSDKQGNVCKVKLLLLQGCLALRASKEDIKFNLCLS